MNDAFPFAFGDHVRHVGDDTEEDRAGVVTGILLRPHGDLYLVTWGRFGDEREHYAFELRKYEEEVPQ